MPFAHDSSVAVAPSSSHSLGAYNRAYLASCPRHFAQIPRYAWNFRYIQPLGEILQEAVLNE